MHLGVDHLEPIQLTVDQGPTLELLIELAKFSGA
jgi:hypothetical protein